MQRTLSVIDLNAIRRNAMKAKSLSNGLFYAVVKADAYGHGAEEVSRCLSDIADGFCVAIIEEGVALRAAGINKPVLVLTPPLDYYDCIRASAYGLTVTVNSVETARLARGLDCHIKVNTGMNRHGCTLRELPAVLGNIPAECIKGVYSHLFAPHDKAASARQLKLFVEAEGAVKAISPSAVAHLAASGGILRGGAYKRDAARCGILLYGYAPPGFSFDGEPAMRVYARKTQTSRFIGGGAGYDYADENYGYLSAYRCGYADGFMRTVPLGEKKLCMDSFVSRRSEELLCVMDNAEAYARRCGTIAYEVLTNATHRSERVYER